MPYISYNIISVFRDGDNYADSSTGDMEYLSADTLEELHQEISDLCLSYHKQNLKCRLLRNNPPLDMGKIEIKHILDFGYCSSYCDDSYPQFGEIILDSIPIDYDLLNKESINDLITEMTSESESKKKSLEEYHQSQRRQRYEELKKEFN